LHLVGGKYFDQLITVVDNVDKFDAMLKFKLELLTNIIYGDTDDNYTKPDIILGDFNSVIPSDIWFQGFNDSSGFDLEDIYANFGQDHELKMTEYYGFLDSQYSYFAEIIFKDDPHMLDVIKRLIILDKTDDSSIISRSIISRIHDIFQKNLLPTLGVEELIPKIINFISKVNQLNIEPYKLLFGNGYKYAKPNDGITNLSGNTIVDCIWYNPKKVTLTPNTCRIINIMDPGWESTRDEDFRSNCISDHNPVYAEFKIGKDPKYSLKYIKFKQKYIKYKNKYLKIKYNLLLNKN